MKKRIIAALLSAMLIITCAPLTAAAADETPADQQTGVLTEEVPEEPSAATEPATEAVTEPLTEVLTEPATEAPTEPLTEPAPVKVPVITGFENTATGTKITFSDYREFENAAIIRVYYWNGSMWKGLGNSTNGTYTHNKLKNGTAYRYTVRALDKSGAFASAYDKTGFENTFYAPFNPTKVSAVRDGMNIAWTANASADSYAVYRKNGSTFAKIGETADLEYTDKNVSANTSYTYAVRAMRGGAEITALGSGKSGKYILTPEVTSIENTATGTTLTWKKCAGAAKYRIFYMAPDGVWRKIGETTAVSFTHKNLKTGTETRYTVRCLDSKGAFASGYNPDGWTNTFIEPPVISSLTNVYGGVSVKWGALKGAERYRIYRKTGTAGWAKVGESDTAEYLDTTAQSNTKYSYTVRSITADGSKRTSYYNNGKSVTYIASPEITKVENTATGTKLTWSKCAGAAKYRVFYMAPDGVWRKIGETTATNYTHDKLANGAVNRYTVRCLDSKSAFCSGYNPDGVTNIFFAPPAIGSVSPAENGNLVSWNAQSGAAGYRLYRKPLGGSWARLFDSIPEASYLDQTAAKNTLYAYTLRIVDEKGELASYYINDDRFYYNGALANGKITVNGTSYQFVDGRLRQGYITSGGYTYYYNADGVLEKNGIVGNSTDGYRYADKDGKIDMTMRDGVTFNGAQWLVLNGKAKKVTTAADKNLFNAFKVVNKATTKDMSKAEKLKKCFTYMQNAYTEKNPRIPHYHGSDWVDLYANDILANGVGNCFSYGAAFGYVARAIGYDNVYACNSGGHGWTEIEGLVYDVEWSRHRHQYSYFALSYNTKTDVDYKGGISSNASWMHVRIYP